MAYAKKQGIESSVLEFSINQPLEEILAGLMEADAQLYAFSVYIWNCEFVFRLTKELKKLRPEVALWCGGPEVSFHTENCLEEHPQLSGIMRGEGEQTFAALAKAYQVSFAGSFGIACQAAEKNAERETILAKIAGLTFRRADGTIVKTSDRPPMDMAELVFPYHTVSVGDKKNTEVCEDIIPDPNRIVYYESSRGCPFLCSYCLSCLEKKLRFKPLSKVFEELDFFLRAGVKQVKFVDRTFNASQDHAMAIWKYLKEHDNGITNFHFEVCAELLSDDAITVLNSLRPGQVQLEIGVQTTNPDTLTAICRQRDWEKLKKNVGRLLTPHNIHVHLDLIAGLPYEDFESFRTSFNEVYGLKPQQLQLGFLKVLKGTPMESFAAEQQFLTTEHPPYEVLSTPWISYVQLRSLKGVEDMVETYYNSHQFEKTLERLEKDFEAENSAEETPFDLYLALAAFMHDREYDKKDHGRMERYELLLEFICSLGLDRENYIPLLLYDYCARERLKHWPAWAGNHNKPEGFDYSRRDPLTGNAL